MKEVGVSYGHLAVTTCRKASGGQRMTRAVMLPGFCPKLLQHFALLEPRVRSHPSAMTAMFASLELASLVSERSLREIAVDDGPAPRMSRRRRLRGRGSPPPVPQANEPPAAFPALLTSVVLPRRTCAKLKARRSRSVCWMDLWMMVHC